MHSWVALKHRERRDMGYPKIHQGNRPVPIPAQREEGELEREEIFREIQGRGTGEEARGGGFSESA